MHPIIECATDISAAVKGVASVEPTFMATAEKEAALVALTEARSRLDALTMRVLAASDDIAQEQAIPHKFLEGILNDMRRGGLVVSQRGGNGGYRLAKPAPSISIADVIRAHLSAEGL